MVITSKNGAMGGHLRLPGVREQWVITFDRKPPDYIIKVVIKSVVCPYVKCFKLLQICSLKCLSGDNDGSTIQ
jgi:hypothetical protein